MQRLSIFFYIPLLPLLPVIFHQGKRVKRDTLRLPEASGTPQGQRNQGQYTLIHVGESTVAGVGVDDIQQGLTASVFNHSPACKRWHSLGRNGFTVQEILHEQSTLNIQNDNAPVVLLLTLGVNDTTRFTSVKNWQKHLNQLVSRLPQADLVACTRVPAMQQFPALPKPLSCFLGLRAWQMDMALKALCSKNNWLHIDTPMTITADKMARDGYHPNAEGYRLWGADIAATIDHIFSGGKEG